MKTKSQFNIGDSIMVNSGTMGENSHDFGGSCGRIIDFDEKAKLVLVEFDSISLDNTPDSTIRFCAENELVPNTYTFHYSDLSKTNPRDTIDEVENAYQRILKRLKSETNARNILQSSGKRKSQESKFDRCFRKFLRSKHWAQLSSSERTNCGFILEVLDDYMTDYFGNKTLEYNADDFEECFLEVLPRKISAPVQTFRDMQHVLCRFFLYLEESEKIPTRDLQDIVLAFGEEMVELSQDPENWGIAKSLVMEGIERGHDMSDPEIMEELFRKTNREMKDMSSIWVENEYEEESPENREFNPIDRPQARPVYIPKIGRNEKVTVKYSDGRILENVKFKKIMDDLADEKCELVE